MGVLSTGFGLFQASIARDGNMRSRSKKEPMESTAGRTSISMLCTRTIRNAIAIRELTTQEPSHTANQPYLDAIHIPKRGCLILISHSLVVVVVNDIPHFLAAPIHNPVVAIERLRVSAAPHRSTEPQATCHPNPCLCASCAVCLLPTHPSHVFMRAFGDKSNGRPLNRNSRGSSHSLWTHDTRGEHANRRHGDTTNATPSDSPFMASLPLLERQPRSLVHVVVDSNHGRHVLFLHIVIALALAREGVEEHLRRRVQPRGIRAGFRDVGLDALKHSTHTSKHTSEHGGCTVKLVPRCIPLLTAASFGQAPSSAPLSTACCCLG